MDDTKTDDAARRYWVEAMLKRFLGRGIRGGSEMLADFSGAFVSEFGRDAGTDAWRYVDAVAHAEPSSELGRLARRLEASMQSAPSGTGLLCAPVTGIDDVGREAQAARAVLPAPQDSPVRPGVSSRLSPRDEVDEALPESGAKTDAAAGSGVERAGAASGEAHDA